MIDSTTATRLPALTPQIQGRFQLTLGQFNFDVNFQIPGRGITAIFGHSGSGKTTLLRCIAGLERATAGFLQINDHCWQDDSKGIFLATHQRSLGYVFQEASLFPHLTVKQNLEYGLRRTPLAQRKIALVEVIELLGISLLLSRRPDRLSGGERQRVAIARALLTSPQLLLMDEPLTALDDQSKAEILPYLEKLHEELAIPLLYVTHSQQELMRLADYMLLMNQGQLIGGGPLSEMLTRFDLPLSHAHEAGVVIEANFLTHDEEFHLTYLEFSGGQLSLPRQTLLPGPLVRVRIQARDVSLALENEVRSSILNVLAATIVEITEEPPGQWLIKLAVGEILLLARITAKSGHLLQLQPGMAVYARVKSLALL